MKLMPRLRTLAHTAAAVMLLATGCGSDGTGSTPAHSQSPGPQCEPAPENPGSIRIGSDYATGDEFDLEIKLEREGPGVPTDAAGVTPVTVQVESVDSAGALLRWRSEATALTGFVVPEDELLEAGISFADLPLQDVLYRIDTGGYFAGVQNTDEVRSAALKALDVFAGVMPDDGSAQALENAYRNMGDEQVALTFAEETLLFHSMDGGVVEPGEGLEYDDLLPNSLGGEPFPATTTFSMTQLFGEGGCVEVSLLTIPKGDEFARIMWETVEGAFGAPADEADVIDNFDVRSEIVASIDYATGQTQRIIATQEVTVGGQTRLETTTIMRIK